MDNILGPSKAPELFYSSPAVIAAYQTWVGQQGLDMWPLPLYSKDCNELEPDCAYKWKLYQCLRLRMQ